jgi:hypothetical protein
MNGVDTSPRDMKAIIARYREIGLIGGLAFGGVVGVMVAGPNFREWSWLRSVVTIAGSVGIGGLLGYIAGEIAVAGLGAGPDGVIHDGSEHSPHTPGLDASGGDSGDGGGGGDP